MPEITLLNVGDESNFYTQCAGQIKHACGPDSAWGCLCMIADIFLLPQFTMRLREKEAQWPVSGRIRQ